MASSSALGTVKLLQLVCFVLSVLYCFDDLCSGTITQIIVQLVLFSGLVSSGYGCLDYEPEV